MTKLETAPVGATAILSATLALFFVIHGITLPWIAWLKGDRQGRQNKSVEIWQQIARQSEIFGIELTDPVRVMSTGSGELLKDETVNQIVDELMELLEATGLSAAEVMEGVLETPVPKQYLKFVRMGFKGGWKSILKRNPEPSKAQVAEAIAMMRAFKNSPHKLRSLIKRKMKEMPHAPGGPPRKIKPEEEKTVCSEIIALRAALDTREAIKRVAVKRGVSERTIYRIWGKHYPKKKSRKS